MKKLLFILIALATALVFSMPASAAEYVGHQECCENCDKCDLGTIDCPDTYVGNDYSDCYNDYFDYDGSPSCCPSSAIGYNTDNDNCKVIFDICCCDADAIAYFTEDQTIGVRMTNLTEGFYFIGDRIYVDMYSPDDDSLCDNDYMANEQPFSGEYSYRDAAGDSVGPADTGSEACDEYPDDERAVVVETPRGEGIQITADMITNNRCKWWFDMPAQTYDAELAVPGARVNVKIELLTAVDGLCGEWKTICECIVDLGLYCVESDQMCCGAFPYVLTQTAGWATGITVVNLNPGVVPYGDMEVKMELVDKAGTVFTYEKTSFASDEILWSFSLDSLLPGFSGTPAAGPALLRIYTNFPMEGYEFLTNGSYAGGTYEECCRRNATSPYWGSRIRVIKR